MKLKPPRDPIARFRREARAIRRVGEDSHCSKCGEDRPLALIPGTNPRICANCQREELGKSKLDDHHPAGIANHPLAIPIPVNDHRAVLSPAQYEWPEGTLENPHGSPLLNGACCIRGYYDTNTLLTDQLLLWVARLLEALDKFLRERLGPDWWVGTPLEQFAPKRTSRESSERPRR